MKLIEELNNMLHRDLLTTAGSGKVALEPNRAKHVAHFKTLNAAVNQKGKLHDFLTSKGFKQIKTVGAFNKKDEPKIIRKYSHPQGHSASIQHTIRASGKHTVSTRFSTTDDTISEGLMALLHLP